MGNEPVHLQMGLLVRIHLFPGSSELRLSVVQIRIGHGVPKVSVQQSLAYFFAFQSLEVGIEPGTVQPIDELTVIIRQSFQLNVVGKDNVGEVF